MSEKGALYLTGRERIEESAMCDILVQEVERLTALLDGGGQQEERRLLLIAEQSARRYFQTGSGADYCDLRKALQQLDELRTKGKNEQV